MSKKRKFKRGDRVTILANPEIPHGWTGYTGIYIKHTKYRKGLGEHLVALVHPTQEICLVTFETYEIKHTWEV